MKPHLSFFEISTLLLGEFYLKVISFMETVVCGGNCNMKDFTGKLWWR